MGSETTLDDSFSTSQLVIKDFTTPCRLDQNDLGGGIFVYVQEKEMGILSLFLCKTVL